MFREEVKRCQKGAYSSTFMVNVVWVVGVVFVEMAFGSLTIILPGSTMVRDQKAI